MEKLKIGIPKGSLEKATIELFRKSGWNISTSSRSYFPRIDDPEIQLIMLRAQEMSRYVEDGVLDAGFTGFDWIQENGSDVEEVCELLYSKATSRPTKWVLAVPNESDITKPEELEGGIIATELVNATRNYFQQNFSDIPTFNFESNQDSILVSDARQVNTKDIPGMIIKTIELIKLLKNKPFGLF